MGVLKAYRFRIYPTEMQRQFFVETFGCVRFTYNTLLKQRQSGGNETKLTPASLKKDYPFLKKTDSLALANAQRHLERAFQNFYRGKAGYPKLKNKRSVWQSYTTNNQHHTIYFQGSRLKLPKLKSLIDVKKHREIQGKIKSATISAKNAQAFYISILCEEEIAPLPKTQKAIGLVFSAQSLVQGTTAITYPPISLSKVQAHVLQAERRLVTKAQSARRRKVKLTEAKNYQKQKLKVARLNNHHHDCKEAYSDEISMAIIQTYDRIFIDSQPKFSQTTLFSPSDWLQLLKKLEYKAKWYGKELVYVPLKKHQLIEIQAEMKKYS
ncbi:MAG: RNA-guided endonuclease TnpB family protein [Enterococcus sp.]